MHFPDQIKHELPDSTDTQARKSTPVISYLQNMSVKGCDSLSNIIKITIDQRCLQISPGSYKLVQMTHIATLKKTSLFGQKGTVFPPPPYDHNIYQTGRTTGGWSHPVERTRQHASWLACVPG